jgi:hypothetical protein
MLLPMLVAAGAARRIAVIELESQAANLVLGGDPQRLFLGDGTDQLGAVLGRDGAYHPELHCEVEQVVRAVPDEPDWLAVFQLPRRRIIGRPLQVKGPHWGIERDFVVLGFPVRPRSIDDRQQRHRRLGRPSRQLMESSVQCLEEFPHGVALIPRHQGSRASVGHVAEHGSASRVAGAGGARLELPGQIKVDLVLRSAMLRRAFRSGMSLRSDGFTLDEKKAVPRLHRHEVGPTCLHRGCDCQSDPGEGGRRGRGRGLRPLPGETSSATGCRTSIRSSSVARSSRRCPFRF